MIEINNLTARSVDEKLLKKVAEKVLKGENRGESNLSVVLVGSARIRKLNKKYRGKNKTTDVLSFSNSDKFPAIPEKEIGEIVICPQVVKNNAKKYNLDYKNHASLRSAEPCNAKHYNKELIRVLIHGVLHLLGYRHDSRPEADKMEKQEDYYTRTQN